ncbi:MAG: hypothetical protein K2N12_00425, partial [Helicobacter sp.]|nr:hypothetical protein [Helicobacter sp.]
TPYPQSTGRGNVCHNIRGAELSAHKQETRTKVRLKSHLRYCVIASECNERGHQQRWDSMLANCLCVLEDICNDEKAG